MDAVDLFAGAGGWDLAAHRLGLRVIGIENNPAACATRRAAGLPTVEGDVRWFGPLDFPGAAGLLASPPCQPYSSAGKGAGRRALEIVVQAVKAMGARQQVDLTGSDDERTALVLEPLRWALEAVDSGCAYRWLAFEQVPAVLPVWEAMAAVLRAEGYSVATGNLQAEQYGVPQTRKRAILIARLDGEATLPAPTHSRYHPRRPDLLDPALPRWTTMETVFGATSRLNTFWQLAGAGATARVTAQQRPRRLSEPAHTITGKGSAAWISPADPDVLHRASVAEVAVLQGFPADYPFHGGREESYRQIGNAIPVGLAEAVIAAATEPATLRRWVTQEDALGWGMTHRPYMAVAPGTAAGGTDPQMLGGSGARVVLDAERAAGRWVDKPWPDGPETWDRPFLYPDPDEPGGHLPWTPGDDRNDGGRLSVNEGAVLQGFPPNYPWHGTKREQFQQVGNAIPVPLAVAVLGAVA